MKCEDCDIETRHIYTLNTIDEFIEWEWCSRCGAFYVTNDNGTKKYTPELSQGDWK